MSNTDTPFKLKLNPTQGFHLSSFLGNSIPFLQPCVLISFVYHQCVTINQLTHLHLTAPDIQHICLARSFHASNPLSACGLAFSFLICNCERVCLCLGPDVFLITVDERAKHDQQFHSLSPTAGGYITGNRLIFAWHFISQYGVSSFVLALVPGIFSSTWLLECHFNIFLIAIKTLNFLLFSAIGKQHTGAFLCSWKVTALINDSL